MFNSLLGFRSVGMVRSLQALAFSKAPWSNQSVQHVVQPSLASSHFVENGDFISSAFRSAGGTNHLCNAVKRETIFFFVDPFHDGNGDVNSSAHRQHLNSKWTPGPEIIPSATFTCRFFCPFSRRLLCKWLSGKKVAEC